MPPKKMGVNSKAEEARARKAAAEAEKKFRETKQKEDQYWREAEGSKSKAAKKREEEEQKRAEAAAKKAEARRLAELEEKEIDKSLKKPDKKANRVSGPMIVNKVTEAELLKRREKEEEEARRKAAESKKKQSRMAEEEEYEKIVLVENKNRVDDLIEARSVEEALAQMSVAEPLPVDKHPEKRLKASFKAFEEAELPRLKAEKPGLTHTQYKEMIWKLWKKSPDNPLNRVTE
ncbi:hypothetical protein RDABS01_020426 [Bienertia sinuspersici]